MAINFNLNNITQVNWNGSSLTQVNWNGVKVWPEVTPVAVNYFYIGAYSGENDLKFKFEDVLETPQVVNLLVSTDKTNWTTFQTNTFYTVASGSKIYFKAGVGGNGGTCDDTATVSRLHFTYEPYDPETTALAIVGGNITTLLNENGLTDMRQSGQTHNFAFLFRNTGNDGTNFRQFYLANDFEIPCTIVQPYAFWQTFRSALAPIDTVNGLYNHFPDLSNMEYVGPYSFGTTWCYESGQHFEDDTVVDMSSLKGSTDGTNIAEDGRYLEVGSNQGVFRNWLRYEYTNYSVKVGPLVPQQYMYDGAFRDSSITSMEVRFTDWGYFGTNNLLTSVPQVGTFKCPTALGTDSTITRGTGNCPAGWTVINTD